jgi:hypothetical protein
MSKFHRRGIVVILCVLFTFPLVADDGFEASVWQEMWEMMMTIISGSDKEGGSVYVPSGIVQGGSDEGGSVYVPSGVTFSEGDHNVTPPPQQPEGGSVYVPSG